MKLNVVVGPLAIFFISFGIAEKEVIEEILSAYVCVGRRWVKIS